MNKKEFEVKLEKLNRRRVWLLYFGTGSQIREVTKRFNELQDRYKSVYGSFYKPKMLNV